MMWTIATAALGAFVGSLIAAITASVEGYDWKPSEQRLVILLGFVVGAVSGALVGATA